MVKRSFFSGILLVCVSCSIIHTDKEIDCTNDEKIDKINTNFLYMEELIKLHPKLGPRTNIETYIEFKDNGQVIYYYKQNGVIKKTPPKYEKGFYFVKKDKLYFRASSPIHKEVAGSNLFYQERKMILCILGD